MLDLKIFEAKSKSFRKVVGAKKTSFRSISSRKE